MEKEGLILEIKSMGISDLRVLEAISKVPREFFVPGGLDAYTNSPLPIGHEQTISQPYTVAFMAQELALEQGNKVLEIGAGSGYNAAIIGKIIFPGKVYSIEIIPELARTAEHNLARAGITNVEVIEGDGSRGYEILAPYDRLIATAAAARLPEAWKRQLKVGGRLIAPVGNIYGQEMIAVTRHEKGYTIERKGMFAFVPLKGETV